jgi:hypothetical protein
LINGLKSRLFINSLVPSNESYLEIQRTKGRRNVTEEDKNEIAALCQSRLERWEKGNAR